MPFPFNKCWYLHRDRMSLTSKGSLILNLYRYPLKVCLTSKVPSLMKNTCLIPKLARYPCVPKGSAKFLYSLMCVSNTKAGEQRYVHDAALLQQVLGLLHRTIQVRSKFVTQNEYHRSRALLFMYTLPGKNVNPLHPTTTEREIKNSLKSLACQMLG